MQDSPLETGVGDPSLPRQPSTASGVLFLVSHTLHLPVHLHTRSGSSKNTKYHPQGLSPPCVPALSFTQNSHTFSVQLSVIHL